MDLTNSLDLTLNRDIPVVNKSPCSLMKNRIVDEMYVNDVVEDEVKCIVKNLKESSPGWDDICAKVIKSTVDSFHQRLLMF